MAAAKSLQSCPTLCHPIDGSPPESAIPGILQARTLEWVAISFSNAWKWKGKVKSLSRVQPSATPWTAAYQAPPSMGFSKQEYWSGVPFRIKYFTVYLVSINLFVDKITCYKRQTPCLCITSPINAYLRKIWILVWPVMLSTCKAWGTLRSLRDSTCFHWNYKPDQAQANMLSVTVA